MMDQEDLIYGYFSNSLTPDEKKRLDVLLRDNVEFRERFEFERRLKKTIVQAEGGKLKAKLQHFETDASLGEDNTEGKELKHGGKRFPVWMVAASVAVLIALGWWALMPTIGGVDSLALYQSNFEPYPNTVVNITRGENGDSLEAAAFMAYEMENFEMALDKLKGLKAQPYAKFYSAQSLLRLNRTEEAIVLLKENIDAGSHFVAESHWYLALAYLRVHQVDLAKDQLTELVREHSYKREAVQVLLTDLD
ncbi:MAG: tol-pal system YbgF family protein [Flavobacteriaceae bacterium]